MTSIGPPSLLHDIGEQADVAGALDRTGQLALLLGGHRGDPRRDDLAALRQVTLKQADVLEIDDRRVLRAEGAGLAAAEKGSCHVLRSLILAVAATAAAAFLLAHHHRWTLFEFVDADGQPADDIFVDRGLAFDFGDGFARRFDRSEEHTSALQSLMR